MRIYRLFYEKVTWFKCVLIPIKLTSLKHEEISALKHPLTIIDFCKFLKFIFIFDFYI